MNKIEKIFNRDGYRIVNYNTDNFTYTYSDKDGYVYTVKENTLMKKNASIKTSHRFSLKNIYCEQNIKKMFENSSYNTSILFDTFKHRNDKNTNFICGRCESIFNSSLTNMINAKYKVCGNCIREVQNTKALSAIDIINRLQTKNLKLLHNRNMSEGRRVHVIDEHGFKGTVNITNYYSFKKYGISNPYALENIKLFLKKNNSQTLLLNNYYEGWGSNLKLKCGCGEVFKVEVSKLLNEKQHRCKKCSHSISRYALMTEEWLKSNNIAFIKEYSYKDCRYKKPLYFDYYIENIGLIEVDGEQHSKPTPFNNSKNYIEEYKALKIRDDIKNRYCVKNNIRLLRIPYNDFNNNNYIQKLNSFVYQN